MKVKGVIFVVLVVNPPTLMLLVPEVYEQLSGKALSPVPDRGHVWLPELTVKTEGSSIKRLASLFMEF